MGVAASKRFFFLFWLDPKKEAKKVKTYEKCRITDLGCGGEKVDDRLLFLVERKHDQLHIFTLHFRRLTRPSSLICSGVFRMSIPCFGRYSSLFALMNKSSITEFLHALLLKLQQHNRLIGVLAALGVVCAALTFSPFLCQDKKGKEKQ